MFSTLLSAVSSALTPTSAVILPPSFTPSPVFKNTNLLRTIDLSKPYEKDVIAVIIENTSKEAQTDYYLPFESNVVDNVSYLEAREKGGSDGFQVSRVVHNPERYNYCHNLSSRGS